MSPAGKAVQAPCVEKEPSGAGFGYPAAGCIESLGVKCGASKTGIRP